MILKHLIYIILCSGYLTVVLILYCLELLFPFPHFPTFPGLFPLIVQDISRTFSSNYLSLIFPDWAQCPSSCSHSNLYIIFIIPKKKEIVLKSSVWACLAYKTIRSSRQEPCHINCFILSAQHSTSQITES